TNGTNGIDGTDGTDGAQGPQGIQGDPGPSWTLTQPSFNTDGTIVVNGTSGSGGPVTSSAGAWLLDGNTNTATRGFGTNSNTHIDFESNSITRGRFLNTGEMLWGGTTIVTPAAAGDPLQSYIINNTNNWAFDGINTAASGGSIFGSNTNASNGYAGIEGSTQGTSAGVRGMHMATSGYGIGIHGTTNSVAAAWAGLFQGDVGSTTGYFIASDFRWKKNIEPINSVMDKVMNLQVKSYQMRSEEFPGMRFDPSRMEFGFIAQELNEVFPEIVHQKAIPNPLEQNTIKENTSMVEGYYTVNYISLIPILTKAIQEQQIQITELESQIDLGPAIDLSNLTSFRIIASSTARSDSGNLFTADSSTKSYIVGVLNDDNNGVSVLRTSGIVEIEVDGTNSQIMAGDFVTVSNMGKAIKSLNSEWVLGVAVSNEINGLVQVRIDIRFKQ
ncbi:tail fiber domain-containing protein, partial [Crocinitomicaceae bacterium]|nr:tail fiber domain-containing protein [Crocinitomicaceae bacterium]